MEYLSRKGIPYTERAVNVDKTAMAELQELGYLTTPVVKIGEEIIVGFDKNKIDAAIANS